jgi:2-C-methyl-D-erythritol 4-phosphate cytidylyltransferase
MKISDLGVVMVAGGSSQRFGGDDKLLIPIHGRPVIICSVSAFLELIPPTNMVVVTSEGREEEIKQLIFEHLNVNVNVVPGGPNRNDSSLNGLKALPLLKFCAVHDAARPFIKSSTIRKCYELLIKQGSAVLAHPVTDTIKIVNSDNMVSQTPARHLLRAAETPQMFLRQELISAYENVPKDISVTDEAMAMELAGHQVFLYIHEDNNRKITYKSDI